jgi:AraC family transcriptional regulator of arabinose operon
MARKDVYSVEEWTDLAKQARYDPESLARLLNVCPRQLRRYTHELFNNSPQDWLDERRLTDAAILLQTNELIKTIAYDLGFKTASHFSNKFKARYGVSPKSYKEQRERFKVYCSPGRESQIPLDFGATEPRA